MSHSEKYTDTGPTTAFYQGVTAERERIIQLLRARTTKHHPILAIDMDDLEALIKGDKILHWCEACDKEENLDPQDAYERGWDFPPKMGSLGIVSPRTCPYCTIDKTAWFAAHSGKPLTKRHLKTIERIKGEIK